jgi:hypothetical protein
MRAIHAALRAAAVTYLARLTGEEFITAEKAAASDELAQSAGPV